MDLIFVGLIVAFGVTVVALLCRSLKRNRRPLGERNVEAAEPLPPAFDIGSEPPAVELFPLPPTLDAEIPDGRPTVSILSDAESSSPAPAVALTDLLLPPGMHDLSTWTRLLSLPNPITGLLVLITMQRIEADTVPAIETLMASFVREGDFGTRIDGDDWVFIYDHDVSGFNRRRVGRIAEKLWDFQLRQLGMENVHFGWAAIDVKSEPLGEAVQAARERINQTTQPRKLPGAEQAEAQLTVGD